MGILEADTIKQVEMKEKIRKEYLRQTRKLFETKFCSRYLIQGINTEAVPLVRYSGPFLKWITKWLALRTRKSMTAHEALHPSDDIDRLYVSRKEGRRALARIEDCVDAIRELEDYIKKNQKGLITEANNITDNIRINGKTITRKQKWEEKQLSRYFKWQTIEISHEKTWTWSWKGDLKKETESLLIAEQNNAIRTN